MNTAFLFPGQGSQAVGMGAELLEQYPQIVDAIFQQADTVMGTLEDGRPFRAVFLQGPEDLLKQTRYTQPALLTVSVAALRVLQDRVAITPSVVSGHSLGEFSALVAAGVLSFESALKLVKLRASLMHQAARGAMAAVLGASCQRVQEVLSTVDSHANGPVALANDNSAEQQVISGTPEAVQAATNALKEAGIKRVIALPVGGAFHSPLMAEAGRTFAEALAQTPFENALVPVVMNVDAYPETYADAIREKLSRQMVSTVQWRLTMTTLVEQCHVSRAIELGSGAVLTGLMKRAYPEVALCNLHTAASFENVHEVIAEDKKLLTC